MLGWVWELAARTKGRLERARLERRWARLRQLGMQIGEGVLLPASTRIDTSHCFLISIGNWCGFGEECLILAHDAQMDEFLDAARIGRVVLHDSCHIGARTIIALASQYGRYGCRRITVLLQGAGWPVGRDRVQRIWRREGLKVPQKQRPRGRLWLNDGSCVRLRPEGANHVWSYDFVSAVTHDGRTWRLLALIDEYTRECLAIRVAHRLGNQEVIETLADVMLVRGIPEYLRSDNGPDFVARELRKWLAKLGTRTLYIEPGSPWENGYCESFNGKLRDECLNGEILYSLKEAQIVIGQWRVEYNTRRPHSALGYRPPVPAAYSPLVPTDRLSQPQAVM